MCDDIGLWPQPDIPVRSDVSARGDLDMTEINKLFGWGEP